MRLGWKVNTPGLLQEVLRNPGTSILAQPMLIFADLLAQVADRAIELDDPQLNILMMRLALYDQADPTKRSFKEIRAAFDAQEKRIPKVLPAHSSASHYS